MNVAVFEVLQETRHRTSRLEYRDSSCVNMVWADASRMIRCLRCTRCARDAVARLAATSGRVENSVTYQCMKYNELVAIGGFGRKKGWVGTGTEMMAPII